MTENQPLIIKCRELIEKKLGWGSSTSWQTQDFENLSTRIFDETNVLLSASTLKRIWGKVQYNSTPNLSTLDALARFVDFPNWRSFTNSSANSNEISVPVVRKQYSLGRLGLVLLISIGMLLIVFVFVKYTVKKLTYNQISFSSSAVTLGVPNTVVFKYDVRTSNADSVFIQQSWDPKRRYKVDRNHHEYTSTYYMPGYYRAKLILNDSVVREHDVFIESNNWMGLFYEEPIPVYLPDSIFNHGHWLGITEADLKNDQLDYSGKAPLFILTHVSKNFNISSENFTLNLELQNTFSRASTPCKQTNIMLLGTEGVIIIPLSAPGCVGELNLRLGEKLIEGTKNDLSAFGVNFQKPVQLRCVSKLNNIRIDLNGNIVYEGVFDKGIGKIIGARISFQGTGYIKSFELNNVY